MALSVKKIEAAKYTSQRDRLVDGNGLYLRLAKGGKKSFQIRHTIGNKRSWITLGNYPELGLKAARDLAGAVRAQLNAGTSVECLHSALMLENDPNRIEQVVQSISTAMEVSKNPSEASMTFKEVASIWFERKRLGLRNGKHIQQNWNTLDSYVFPSFGDRLVAEISRKDVIAAIAPIWHKKHETARRTLARTTEVFELAELMELREGNPAVFNPRVALGLVKRQSNHFGSLSFEQMPDLWQWLQSADCEEETRQNAMLMALTAKRSGEARKVEWDHIDLLEAQWNTPADMMKMSRAHRVPLVPECLIIFENMRVLAGGDGKVFAKPSNKTGLISENTVCLLLKRFDYGITAHGLRASFKTWATVNKYDGNAIEFALAHEQKGLDAAYQRSDLFEERKGIMRDWAHFVTAGTPPRRLAKLLQ